MRKVDKEPSITKIMSKKLLRKKGQAGVEYLIIVAFVTFMILGIVGLAYIFSEISRDQIVLNQAENFASKLIDSAEAVFFAGEPSKSTVSLYLPEHVNSINVSGVELTLTISTSTGTNIRTFTSRVPLQGTIPSSQGIKVLTLTAQDSFVLIE